MTESRFDPEDEAFNEIERQAKQRMEAVKTTMEKHMNNPPAFPSDAVKDPFDRLGMTLRDYFAAKAMQAFIQREAKFNPDLMMYAGAAYDVADAMLKARET